MNAEKDTNEPPVAEDDAIGRGHEPDVVDSRLVVVSSAGLVLLVALVLLLMSTAMWFLASEEPTTKQTMSVRRRQISAGPSLNPDQPRQLQDLRKAETQRLNNYEWMDEPAGIARIPIDRAMQIVAKQGLPMTATAPKSEDDNDDKSK